MNVDRYGAVIACGWMKKSWKSTKAFLKKHKKAIIIGAIIVVTVSAVTVVVTASSSGAASTLAGSAAAIAASNSSNSDWEEEENSSISSNFGSTMKEEIHSFKEKVAEENLLEFSFSEEDLSMESKAKTLGNVWAHQTLEGIHNNFENLPSSKGYLELGHREIDKKFPIENDYLYHQGGFDCDNKNSSYQIQAEKAFDLGYYPEAVRNLNQAIDIEPNNSTLYLERAASQFHMGEYQQALQDFEKFTTHSSSITEQNPLSISEFSIGFTKGLPQGVYESGKGIMPFLSDFVMHPVHTSTQVVQSLSTLAELVGQKEWEIIGKSVAPEICKLVKE
ncbi:MAG: tetratricopeptide repeat protein [Chlamydiales bacterium]